MVDHSAESLYPDWSGEEQSRAFSYDGDELVLRAPLMRGAAGTVVNDVIAQPMFALMPSVRAALEMPV